MIPKSESLFPEYLNIETTNRCNLKCVMCPRDKMTRAEGTMDMALYRKIVKDCSNYVEHMKVFNLFMDGEPLLDDLLEERIRIAKKSGIRFTEIATNGTLLNRSRARSLVESGLDSIIIAIEDIDAGVHERIRQGSSYNKIISNSENLISIRNEAGSTTPEITVRMLGLEENSLRREAFLEHWKTKVEQIIISPAHNWGGTVSFGSESSHPNIECFYLWKQMVILVDGTVALCCLDYDGVHKLGNVRYESIYDIWHGEKFKEYREKFKKNQIDLCNTCNWVPGSIMAHIRPESERIKEDAGGHMNQEKKIARADIIERSFDLYTRYFFIARLADQVRTKTPMRILDAGGSGGLLGSFLKKDKIVSMDIVPASPDHVFGNITCAPFESQSFDLVISSDTYEHIPSEKRAKAIAEMLRLSKNFVILGAPFYSREVKEAEVTANNFWLKATGEPHRWLKEHIHNKLPNEDELERLLKQYGYDFYKIGTNNLPIWLMLMLFSFYAQRYQVPQDKVGEVWRCYNKNFANLGDFEEPTYRKIYLIAKCGTLPQVSLYKDSKIDRLKQHTLMSLVVDSIREGSTQKDSQISDLEASLQGKDSQISDLEASLQGKDSQISDLEASLQGKDSQIEGLENRIATLNSALQNMNFRIVDLEIQMERIYRNIIVRFLNKYQRVVEKLLRPGTRRRYYYELGLTGIRVILNEGWKSFGFKFRRWLKQKAALPQGYAYKLWIAQNEPKAEELDHYRQESLSFQYRPQLSIIADVWNADEKWLRSAIESVLNQVYNNWELCIADGNSTKPRVRKVLQEYAEKDSRIRVKFLPENKGISGNFNEAMSLATGEFIGILNHDDELAPHALYEVAKLLNENPEADFIYSDEDGITNKGKRVNPFLKPDWSPDMLLSCMYTGHLSIYGKAIINDIGGFRIGSDDAVEYDLVLRFIEKASGIYHIPKVLYHNRVKKVSSVIVADTSPQAQAAGKKSLEDYLVRNGIEGELLVGKWAGTYRVKRRILGNPLVSIIVPTRDKLDFLKPCIESILKKTDYDNYEIIIVDNHSQEPQTACYFDEIKKNSKVKIIEYNKPFNFAAINNYAASQVSGDYVLFLNNDTKVISREWLSAMLEHAQRKEVGLVGALLLYSNNKIQHAGMIAGSGMPGRHIHRYLPSSSPGYYLRPHLVQNLSAVTGACILLRKEVFQEVSGFDDNLPIIWNDVDICLKIREKGYRIVYTPYARLYHSELTSRRRDDITVLQAEDYIRSKWGQVMKTVDPYYNPGLTQIGEDFALRIGYQEPVKLSELLPRLDTTNIAGNMDWLNESVNGDTGSPIITRLWHEIYRSRCDLQAAYPDIFGADRKAFLNWVSKHGRNEYPFLKEGSRKEVVRSFTKNVINAGAILRFELYRKVVLPLESLTVKIFMGNSVILDTLRPIGKFANRLLLPNFAHTLKHPSSKVDSSMEFGINIAGYLTGEFGIGAAARALTRAIQDADIPYVLNNIESPIHSSQDSTHRSFSKVNPYPVNLIHVNANESLHFLSKKGIPYFAGKYNIGYWAWELSHFPEEWFDSFRYYNEIWVLSNFCLESLSKVSPLPVAKIFCLDIDESKIDVNRSLFGSSHDSYVFLFNFDFHSHFQRKNPLALVKAFKMAFSDSDDASLVIKCINHNYYPSEAGLLKKVVSETPNIKIIDTHLRKDDLYSLVASCDCYVSLHRSEGFGLTMAEAMYFKKPIIATGYSGNMDFMNVNNSFPIRYELVEVGEKDYPPFKKGYVWAEPDVIHAAELMRFVYGNRDYAAQIGEQASKDIKELFSPAVVGQEIRERLEKILASR